MKRLWQTHKLLVIAFAVALTLTLGFGIRAAMFVPRLHFKMPNAAEQPVQAWMTPKFIVHTYDMPGPVVGEVLGIDRGTNPDQPISAIAKARGVDPTTLTIPMDAAIKAYHESLKN